MKLLRPPITAAPPLNRVPTGLLDFLGIKNGGRNPVTLGEVLAPTWNLAQHYLDAASQTRRGTGNLTNADRGLIISYGHGVPDGQVWWIDRVSLTTALLVAGQTLQVSFVLVRNSNPTFFLALPGTMYQGPTAAGGAETYTVGCDVQRTLYAGDSINVKIDKITDAAGAVATSCELAYTPMVTNL